MLKNKKKHLSIKIKYNKILLGFINLEKNLKNLFKVKKNINTNKRIFVSNFFFFKKKKIRNIIKYKINNIFDKKLTISLIEKKNIKLENYKYLIFIFLLLIKKIFKNGLIGFF